MPAQQRAPCFWNTRELNRPRVERRCGRGGGDAAFVGGPYVAIQTNTITSPRQPPPPRPPQSRGFRREPPLGSPSFPQLLPLSHTKEIRRQKKLRGLGQKQRTEREKDRGLAPKCHLGVWELPRRSGQLPIRLGGSWGNSVSSKIFAGCCIFPRLCPVTSFFLRFFLLSGC